MDITYPGSDTVYGNFCKQTRILGIIKILKRLNQNDLLNLFLQNDKQIEYISTRRNDKLKYWKVNG